MTKTTAEKQHTPHESSTQLMFQFCLDSTQKKQQSSNLQVCSFTGQNVTGNRFRTKSDRSSGHQHAKEESSVLLSSSRRLKLLMNLTPKFWFV